MHLGVCTTVPQTVIDGCQTKANSKSLYENDQFSRQPQTEPSWHRPQQGWSNNGWSSGWQGSAASSSWQDDSEGAKGGAKGDAKGGKGGKGGGGKIYEGPR